MYVIYVDDEQPALDNFKWTVAKIEEIKSLKLFQSGEQALVWSKKHKVDVAFLDMEMPELHGIALARKLQEIKPDIRIVFVTAFSQYAMDAWNVDASGYILKPYAEADIRKELGKCTTRQSLIQHVVIQTIPTLAVLVNGRAVDIAGKKTREMFALMVDRGECGITSGETIAYLWPERPNDLNTQSLFRMTYKRLADSLEEAGIGHIIFSQGHRKFVKIEQVDCDLYRILSGDKQAALKYDGQYMREYSWAEERNGQLYRMLLG